MILKDRDRLGSSSPFTSAPASDESATFSDPESASLVSSSDAKKKKRSALVSLREEKRRKKKMYSVHAESPTSLLARWIQRCLTRQETQKFFIIHKVLKRFLQGLVFPQSQPTQAVAYPHNQLPHLHDQTKRKEWTQRIRIKRSIDFGTKWFHIFFAHGRVAFTFFM